MAMGVKTSHVIKFIRKGDDGKHAMRYWLVPSTTSVAVPVGGGQPAPSTVSCVVMKQIGDNAPVALTDLTAEGLTLKHYYQRADGRQSFAITYAGPVEVAANESFRSLCFELHSGTVLIDTATVAIMRDGKPGAPGDDGEDAVIYRLVPSDSMIAVRDFDGESGNVAPGILMCSVTRQAGTGEPVVISPTDDGFVIAVVAIMPDGNKIRRGTYDEENGIDVSTYPTLSGWELQLWHEESQVLFDTVTVPILRDGTPGGKGDRGPVLRGPQDWTDCADGYPFESGAEGEQWQDVVIYDGHFYSCEKSHTKSFATFPNSPADGQHHYWQLATKMDIIATKILLSTYALVKNLGVETIDMRDADGNILFQAKDGNVTCKTGDFENITVSGHVTANVLDLKISSAPSGSAPNGSICMGVEADPTTYDHRILLPELPEGAVRNFRYYVPAMSRATVGYVNFDAASTDVKISSDASLLHATLQTLEKTYEGYYEFMGFNNDGITYWLLLQELSTSPN